MTMKEWLVCGALFLTMLLTSCCHKDCPASSGNAAPALEVQRNLAPQVSGKWTGRWESGKHKGHGGGLNCLVTAAGPNEWDAVFTAEFGKIKDYTIKLKGKPEGDKVVFGGKVDLGKEDGGIFTWTGSATASEFNGQYEGGGDTGSFKMSRAAGK